MGDLRSRQGIHFRKVDVRCRRIAPCSSHQKSFWKTHPLVEKLFVGIEKQRFDDSHGCLDVIEDVTRLVRKVLLVDGNDDRADLGDAEQAHEKLG